MACELEMCTILPSLCAKSYYYNYNANYTVVSSLLESLNVTSNLEIDKFRRKLKNASIKIKRNWKDEF